MGNRKHAHDCIGIARFQKLDASIDVFWLAQGIGGLKEANAVKIFPLLLKPVQCVLDHRQCWCVIL